MEHIPVLLQETIDGLDLHSGDVVVDGTLGYAGHSSEICKKIGRGGILIGFDQDEDALTYAKERLSSVPAKIIFIQDNFRNIAKHLGAEGISDIDKALLDLGVSSKHFDDSGRGFTFKKDEPLIMSMKKEITEEDLTAKEIVNSWAEESIADILYGFGEERFARKIAREIIAAREKKEIETTFELVEIIKRSVPVWYQNRKIHPATKTFQALRITVNDELGALRDFLDTIDQFLVKGGRIAIITFHSLEDRIVKNIFKEKSKEGVYKLVNKKTIKPTREEIIQNPRSRSAQLRIVEKII